jgi:hypothetical protein
MKADAQLCEALQERIVNRQVASEVQPRSPATTPLNEGGGACHGARAARRRHLRTSHPLLPPPPAQACATRRSWNMQTASNSRKRFDFIVTLVIMGRPRRESTVK